MTSDGLMTTVLPAARAGNSFQPSRPSGVFQGVMAATTPSGSRSVNVVNPGRGGGTVAPFMRLGETAEEAAVGGDRSYARAHLGDELAVLEDLLPDERVGLTFDQIGQAKQRPRPLARQAAGPAPVGERARPPP